MANRPLIRGASLACALLVGGCAGWSTWDEERTVVVPEREVGADDYMVVSGDTMYSIAFRHQLDYRQLARWNGVGSDYLIFPGQVLRLKPAPGTEVARERYVTGEIESVGMDDVAIGKPRAIQPGSPAPRVPPAPEEPPQTAVGGYAWSWPTAGTVLRGFGKDGNRGLDLAGNDGQPILAAAPGRVVYSGNALKGYGELIIIKHDELFLSAYGYNARRHVKEGDVVTAGQPIATMGRGPENRPMLHFEIRRSGKPVNPANLLPAHTVSANGG
ncbi:MAG: peptidoglycan DD-metalloendopeptidase family protein [Sinimarinibacterium flocculans]|uniref:Murein DD-endopeptidase MepM/ murein hydrolase activator NlpD n=1 Tax=Sinimarinibacterium flocculans TaxID=985250 RepID=A0A318EIB3_9GAMM|nr:peptidoglycan DD-metalloendopeptidase family protein [Sinimarinibacterium flocculans]MEC9362700.1 peptidoglycan DD-metalloendopeptidase family protein [Pseudomonadota bacterium]PXV68464.1 murein DD-endopeptidase MepM/ murein hydrolase activator NlpD [Sinimarinibacterium flocculans]